MSTSQFRLLIIASFAALGLSILFEPAAIRGLPTELRTYVDDAPTPLGGVGELLRISIAVAYLGVVMASAVGLYRLRAWARPLAVTITLLTLIAMPLLGPRVQSGWTAALLDVEWVLWGAVLATSYWSPVAGRFVTPRQTTPAA